MPTPHSGDCLIRILHFALQNEVVFVHRRVRFISTGGLEMFKMEPTGTPLVEVLPEKMRAIDLYAAVSSRVRHLLKSPVSGYNTLLRSKLWLVIVYTYC